MSRIFFLLCAVAIALTGCNEQKKIDALMQENAKLEASADSLRALIAKAQGATSKWLVKNDTVRAGDGLFQVLYRMNINEKERGKIVIALQDSVELSALRVGQVFYAALDSAGDVQRFRFAPNPATVHMLSKVESGFAYSRIDKPVSVRQSVFEGALEAGSTLNGILYKVGIPGRMVGVVSGILQCKVSFQLARPGDKFRILLEEKFYQDSIWISGKVLYAEFNGHTVGHHEAFRYEDPDPVSVTRSTVCTSQVPTVPASTRLRAVARCITELTTVAPRVRRFTLLLPVL